MTSAGTGRICIVSGADANMESLLHGLLRSLADTGVSARAHVAVLDFGLSGPMRADLAGLCDQIVDPTSIASSAIGFIDPKRVVLFYRVLLPTLVPGHDIYLWLDADTWVQSPEMLSVFAGFATAKDVAIAAETDPAYGNVQRRHDWTIYRAKEMYGPENAHQLAIHQYLNAGVIAARARSPLWRVWLDHISEWRDRPHLLLSDQVTLNYLILKRKVSAYILPAVYNWVCHAATPKWFTSKGHWARPLFPHTKIAVMHLTSTSRQYSTEVAVGGRKTTIDLTYPSALRLRELA